MKICPITSRYSTAELESLKYTNKVLRRENIDFIIENDFLKFDIYRKNQIISGIMEYLDKTTDVVWMRLFSQLENEITRME